MYITVGAKVYHSAQRKKLTKCEFIDFEFNFTQSE